jgi:uncharacterized protein
MAILRKIKDKFKKIARPAQQKSAVLQKKQSAAAAAQEIKNVALGAQQTIVERAKYSHPEHKRMPRPMPQELPYQYDVDRIVLLVRDVRWLYAYWELKGATVERLKNEWGEAFYSAKRVLRVYDVSNIIFNGQNAHRFFDVYVNDLANNWYIDTAGPGRSWCVDFGLLLADGRFITIVRSNTVHTPLDGPSWITDEEWMIPEEMFARLYGIGFGLGQSSPVGRAWEERVKQALSSGGLSSPGVTSGGSFVRKISGERKFWFVANCELIVYGATEPDATVTVQGKPISLRRDGTFSLRFALPDGRQVIPLKAVSADKVEERTITPTVSRETKVG